MTSWRSTRAKRETASAGMGELPTLVPSCYAARFNQRADSNGIVLWVSTLRTLKRPELFLELARRSPHLRFRMVGGPVDAGR